MLAHTSVSLPLISLPRHLLLVRPLIQLRHVSGGKQWTKDDLTTTPQYPLSQSLLQACDPRTERTHARGAAKRVYLRPQIVSPDLCDDVIAYYGHTLEKYKGCDILDLNPGAGLWSSKLHDFLQPRSHILFESQIDKFGAFLNPLVDKPNSKYRLIAGNPTEFPTFDQLVNGDVFPHQKRITPGDARASELNTSILITGSIAWEPVLPGFGFDSMSKQLFFKYTTWSWYNEFIHAFGRARMLLWFMNDDMKTLVPRSMLHAAKSSFTAQKLANVTEVVGSGHMPRKRGRDTLGREPYHEIESLVRAMNTMKSNGTELPPHRRENIHHFAEEISQRTNGTGIVSLSECTQFLQDKVKLGMSVTGLASDTHVESWQWRDTNPTKPNSKSTQGKNQKRANFTLAKDKKASQASATLTRMDAIRQDKFEIVELGYGIYELECKILGMPEDDAKTAALEELKELQDAFETRFKVVGRAYTSAVLTDIDDRISIRSGVPRISWDNRNLEPLIMQPDEAWPVNRMSLADIEPRPMPEGQASTQLEYFQDFISALFLTMAASLPTALESLQPGAGEIMDSVPALRDPAQGGRLDMEQLRVRMLTVEMVDELCKAYHEWPFKHPEADHASFFRSKSDLSARKGVYEARIR